MIYAPAPTGGDVPDRPEFKWCHHHGQVPFSRLCAECVDRFGYTLGPVWRICLVHGLVGLVDGESCCPVEESPTTTLVVTDVERERGVVTVSANVVPPNQLRSLTRETL